MAWQTLRTVVEELDVANLVDVLNEKHPRFEEAWEGLKWLLARTPVLKGSTFRRSATGEYRAYVLAADELAGTPDIWVVYTYTDTEVTVLGVTTADPIDEEETDTVSAGAPAAQDPS